MSDINFEEIHKTLQEVGKFFKLGRKNILRKISSQINIIEKEIISHENKLSFCQQKLTEAVRRINKSNVQIKLLKQEKNATAEKLSFCQQKLTEAVRRINKSNVQIKLLKQEKNATAEKLSFCQQKLTEAVRRINKSNVQIKLLKQEKNAETKKFKELNKKHTFLTRILSATSEKNKALETFKLLLQKDFIEFANKEKSLSEEANAILKLQLIQKQVEEVVSFSGILNRNIVAVGGGFSAGKSEFISSFFKKNTIKLPIGIKPVTAIPTFVIPNEQESIYGYTNKGGKVEISPELYESLSHDFLKSFGFNIKELLPSLAVAVPIVYTNICFIDTPGYNAATTCDGFTDEDIYTAKEHLERANTVLWLIGLDSNGTISSTDIEFLQSLSLRNKHLYIVANKADLRPEEDIKEILESIAENLDYEDIKYEGISAFNSIDNTEIHYKKSSIFSFFETVNKKIDLFATIRKDLDDIFQAYNGAISEDIAFSKKISNELNSLGLDYIEAGYSCETSKILNRVTFLKNQFSTKRLQEDHNALKKLSETILESLKEVFKSIV